MNNPESPIDKLSSDYEKFNKTVQELSDEHQQMIEAVDQHIKSQTTEKLGYDEILQSYFIKYEDFLDSPLVENMSDEEKTDIIKQEIYHEIEQKKKNSFEEKKKLPDKMK